MTLTDLLVALDGSGLSKTALEAAISIGKPTDARIHLLHVVPKLEEYARHTALFEPLRRELARVGQDIVDEAARTVESAGVSYEKAVTSGIPAEEISDYARDHGISLIVMGSRGLTRSGNHLLGSVSYQVAMRAPCSVLVAKTHDVFSRILLAVDGSEDSRRATEFVEFLAPKFQAKIALMFVVPSRPNGAFTLAATPAEPFLLETEKRLKKAGLNVERDLKYGHPAGELLKAAERSSVVALGARGRSDLALDYVGGVADKVLRNAKCSVLMIR